jgi:hypothetical protein
MLHNQYSKNPQKSQPVSPHPNHQINPKKKKRSNFISTQALSTPKRKI